MSLLDNWLFGAAQTWLDRFRLRHGLAHSPSHDSSADSALAASAGDASVLLHVGCGRTNISHISLPGFQQSPWREIRFDADPGVCPDIVGSMVDMFVIDDHSVDAIYSSHNIEHLYPHEVPAALAEFFRVLTPSGFLVLTCPDLQSLCQLIVDDKLDEPAYVSPAGPIAPIDILYGLRTAMAAGNLYMAHRCGFTLTTLIDALREAGFAKMYGFRRPSGFDLWVLASKSPRSTEEMAALATDYLPVSN